MDFKIESIKENVIRISDEFGSSATVGLSKNALQILSFYVPEDKRKNGIGKAMLDEIEQVAISQDKKKIECDYRSDLAPFSAMLKNSGYEILDGKTMVSVNTKDLINSTGVKKSLRVKLREIESTCFSEMMPYQIDEVRDFLKRIHIDFNEERLEKFDDQLSCVVYNKDYKIRAVLLTTVLEKEILVDLLVGLSKRNPEHVLAVCQEFVKGILENNMAETHSKIVVLAIREEVTALFKRLLDKEYELYQEVKIDHAIKKIDENAEDELYFAVGEYVPWQNDLSDIPYQYNISEKQLWFGE